MTNCKYITKNGRCGLKGSYAYRHGCFGEDMCRCREPMTNADRIRAMSDEELAVFLVNCLGDVEYCHAGLCKDGETCRICCLRWLQQPTGEEDKYETN